MQALGPVLANKHAEGYPGKRYESATAAIANSSTSQLLFVDMAMSPGWLPMANIQIHLNTPSKSPIVSSGILIETPAITVRRMKQVEASQLAE